MPVTYVTGCNSSAGGWHFIELDRWGLFGSNAARVAGLCRTMEHGIGSGSTVPGVPGRSAEGVMVRRPSVASLDSGAESPVYGDEPEDRVGRGDSKQSPPVVRVASATAVLGAPPLAATPDNWRHVGCRPAKRKMVCKGHPCIHATDEDLMTRFASSMTARRRRRLLGKRTDAHGREG